MKSGGFFDQDKLLKSDADPCYRRYCTIPDCDEPSYTFAHLSPDKLTKLSPRSASVQVMPCGSEAKWMDSRVVVNMVSDFTQQIYLVHCYLVHCVTYFSIMQGRQEMSEETYRRKERNPGKSRRKFTNLHFFWTVFGISSRFLAEFMLPVTSPVPTNVTA